jgi:hypothetical protein
MAGLDPAIKVTLKDIHFLLLDGPIKSGHDVVHVASASYSGAPFQNIARARLGAFSLSQV